MALQQAADVARQLILNVLNTISESSNVNFCIAILETHATQRLGETHCAASSNHGLRWHAVEQMSCTTDDFAFNEDYLYAFASRRTSGSMSGRTTTDNDQFLIHVHVDEVTGTDVVVLDVVVDEVVVLVLVVVVVLVVDVEVVVVSPKLGKVV